MYVPENIGLFDWLVGIFEFEMQKIIKIAAGNGVGKILVGR